MSGNICQHATELIATVTSNPAVLLTARQVSLPRIAPDIFGTILAVVLVLAIIHELQIGFYLFIVITHKLPPFSAHSTIALAEFAHTKLQKNREHP